MPHFEIAIVDSNILAAMGLQQILADMLPGVEVRVFNSFDELQAVDQGQFVHYFVASRIYFEHASFFREGKHRVIVLVNGDLQVAGVPTLNVCQNEAALVKELLAVHRQGHPHGAPMPPHGHGAMVQDTLLLLKSIVRVLQHQVQAGFLLARWKWQFCWQRDLSTRK